MNLTIIVTTYNSAHYIEKCIKSILDQRYNLQEIQLIIIDDSSIDDTLEIITSLNLQSSFGQFCMLKTDVNSGPGEARNMGIARHTGDYVIFVDSDDELLPNALSEVSAKTNEITDLILYDSIRSYMDGEEIHYCKHERSLGNDLSTKLNAILSLETDDHVIHSAYKSSYLKKLRPFSTGFYEDIRFQAHAILEATSISHISTPIYLKNCHNKQITAFMDYDRVLLYLKCRISLHEEILFHYSGHGENIEQWSNFGLRGVIALTLNKMQKFYSDEKIFNSKTKKIFRFLSVRIDNLDSIMKDVLKSSLDYQAKVYYDRFHQLGR